MVHVPPRTLFQRATTGAWGTDPAAFDPAFVTAQLPWVGRLFGPGRYFDVHVEGWEHVPPGPVMLVSNHSGGTTVLDGWGVMWAWYDHFGTARPLHGLAHEAIFATEATGRYFARLGILRAAPDTARRALVEHGRSLMVMPGGELDVWRPASERYRVRFGGRMGYARTAVELGVPIVPVAHVGAHHTLHVLTDGRDFARRIGLKRLARAEVFPVHLSLPWGIGVGPWPHLPPPTRLDYRLGPAIQPDASAESIDAAVRESIQGMLDAMRRERPPLADRARRALRRRATALLEPLAGRVPGLAGLARLRGLAAEGDGPR